MTKYIFLRVAGELESAGEPTMARAGLRTFELAEKGL
jgi:hypothetical protein